GAEAIVAGLLAAVRAHSGEAPQSDDIAILAVRVLPEESSDGGFACHLRADPAGIVRACEALRAFCASQGLAGATGHDAVLALEEILANVARHGYGGDARGIARVRGRVAEGWLELEIRDRGRAFDPLSAPAPDLDLPLDSRP